MGSYKSIAIIIPYFGKWPEWFELYLETCKFNESINWFFLTDCEIPNATYSNVSFIEFTFAKYKALVSSKLGINFNPDSPYKLCDIRPALGYIHQDIIEGFDYYGFGDIDVVYGNIRKFYTDDILTYNCISSHRNRISGHLCLFKNTLLNKEVFFKIENWQSLFLDKNHLGIDESKLTKIYLRHKKYPEWLRKIYGFHDPYQRSCYFKEQYSTILFPHPWVDGTMEHPQLWYWRKGKLTNNKDGNREFMYLHFMNWKSSLWLRKMWGDKAAWESLDKLNYVPKENVSIGWAIGRDGFHSLDEADS